jgi:ParB-like chromosome segregation protein Spo0J
MPEKTVGNIKVESREIAALIPFARNSRTHSDAQVAQIAASIREFGWTNPILVDGSNGIIAGHGRLAAARKLGVTEIPVIVLDGLSDAQKRAYVIADNKLALNAGWDMELLKVELQDLDAGNFDLTLTGFDLGELTALFDQPNFDPGTEEDQGKLDELAPKMVQCPHCGQEYDLREHGQG